MDSPRKNSRKIREWSIFKKNLPVNDVQVNESGVVSPWVLWAYLSSKERSHSLTMGSAESSFSFNYPDGSTAVDKALIFAMLTKWKIEPGMSDEKINEILQPVFYHVNDIFVMKDDPRRADLERTRMLIGSQTYGYWEQEIAKNPEILNDFVSNMEQLQVPIPK